MKHTQAYLKQRCSQTLTHKFSLYIHHFLSLLSPVHIHTSTRSLSISFSLALSISLTATLAQKTFSPYLRLTANVNASLSSHALSMSLSLSPTHTPTHTHTHTHTHTPSNSFYRLIPIDTTPHVRDFLRQGVNPISEKETSAKLTRQWERWQLIERSRVRNQSMREKRNQLFCSPSHRRRRWLAQSAGY